MNVRWYTLPQELVKLNIDGVAKDNPSKAACGGVIRNCLGHWLVGFVRNIGVYSAFNAELWGAAEGLELAWASSYRKIILEYDS